MKKTTQEIKALLKDNKTLCINNHNLFDAAFLDALIDDDYCDDYEVCEAQILKKEETLYFVNYETELEDGTMFPETSWFTTKQEAEDFLKTINEE
jgi:hypothetical protein